MKIEKRNYVFGFVLMMFGAAIILSGCASAEQKPSTPYVSPIQDILYGKSLSFKEASPGRDAEALGNTRWRLRSIRPRIESPFKSTEFSFERSGILVESGELPNGTIYTDTHRYRVVGSTLVLTKGGRTSVATFRVEGDTLNIDGDDYSLTLERFGR
jgi:hypothetical protein